MCPKDWPKTPLTQGSMFIMAAHQTLPFFPYTLYWSSYLLDVLTQTWQANISSFLSLVSRAKAIFLDNDILVKFWVFFPVCNVSLYKYSPP